MHLCIHRLQSIKSSGKHGWMAIFNFCQSPQQEQDCHCWEQRQCPVLLLSKQSTDFFFISAELWLKTGTKNGNCFFTGNQCSKKTCGIYTQTLCLKNPY